MRIKFFQTPKPRQYSFHTRYYDEKKMNTEDSISVGKGSFSKYKNKYRSNSYDMEREFASKERNRKLLILGIFVSLSMLYLVFKFSGSLEKFFEAFL